MFMLENHSGFLSCTNLWTISTEKAQFKHNTLCVISTERGNCLTPHWAIHTDGIVAFCRGNACFLAALIAEMIVSTLFTVTKTFLMRNRVLHHPVLYKVFELFLVAGNKQSAAVVY